MFAFFSLYYCIFHPILIEYNFEYAFYFKSNINLTTIYLLDKKEIYMPVNIGDICIFEGIIGKKNKYLEKVFWLLTFLTYIFLFSWFLFNWICNICVGKASSQSICIW